MLFPTIFSFTILVATAAADLHIRCSCFKSGTYDAGLTESACSNYNSHNYPWGNTVYDPSNGQCAGEGSGQLGGNEWEEACQTVAKSQGINSGIRGGC